MTIIEKISLANLQRSIYTTFSFGFFVHLFLVFLCFLFCSRPLFIKLVLESQEKRKWVICSAVYKLTSLHRLAGHLSLRLQQLDVRCETKTKDNVFVNVVASIQYRALADKANDAFYKLTNTRTQIQAYVFDVIRASVPKLNLDDVFEQKTEIAKAVEEELEKAMSAYGYEIVQTLIVDIEPDEHVKRAMNEINAAARMRVAANEKAEAEKILQIKRAEGEAESKYLSGLGIARQRQAIVDGLRDSVLGFSVNVPGTTAKDVMDMVLVTQYFDTMKEIGAASKSSAVFIPHGPGAVRDVATQIRDGLLQASQL
ncbi:hypothetical protein V6N13_030785 [Hibiscus sabdariffa]|uniref:Band 7 domain-containing protein n=2 Tax=Hibiscus sabdariffa TaxID=183260 RepID=A0ABR1ZT86_9ROSI